MRFPKKYILAFTPLAIACSAAPGESVSSTSSAINPEGSINSVSDTIGLSSIGVISAWNDIEGGTYVEYAALGASVLPVGSTGNATLQNPIVGCSLGAVPVGTTPPPGGVQFRLSSCKSGTNLGGPAGSTLAQIVTLHDEGDVANFAIALDNIETTSVSTINDNLASDLGLVADTLKVAGQYGTTFGWVVGGVGEVTGALSGVGSAVSLVESWLSPPTKGTACTGGLISVANPAFNGSKPAAPLDTLRFSYSAAQLEALTANTGTAVLTTNVAVTWPSALPGDEDAQCDSQHQIVLTITRNPDVGPAADPLSGSAGVARSATEVDAIVADAAHLGMAEVKWTPSGWSSAMVTGSNFEPGLYTPTATVSRQLPPVGSMLTLIPGTAATSTTPATPATTNLQGAIDSFWFDAKGGLQWTSFAPGGTWYSTTIAPSGGVPNGRIAATSSNPGTLDVFWVDGSGNLDQFDSPYDVGVATTTGFGTTTLASNVAPAQAGVAAVSRAFDSMDVLYLGNDGNLHDEAIIPGKVGWQATTIGTGGKALAGTYVTAVARDANTIDAFFQGNDGNVYWASYAHSAVNGQLVGWQSAQPIANLARPGAPITAVSRAQGAIDIVYCSTSGLELVQQNTTSGRTGPARIPALGTVNPDTDLSLVAPDDHTLVLFYRDVAFNQYAGTWNQTSGAWSFQEISLPQAPFQVAVAASSLMMSPEQGTVESTVTTVTVSGAAGQTVNLTATGLPSGVTATLSPSSVATGGSSTLTLIAANGVAPQTFTMTVTATGTGANSAIQESVAVPVTLSGCIPVVYACGGTICGTMSNECGGTYTCPACPVTCTTPACECRANGGVYQNGRCN